MSTRIFVIVAFLVVLLGGATGYFLVGPRSAPRPDQVQVAQAPAPEADVPEAAPRQPARAPVRRGTDYTAPGAPKVDIVEERTPAMNAPAQTPGRKPKADFLKENGQDAEASQEGAARPDTPPPDAHDDDQPPTSDNTTESGDTGAAPASDDSDFEKIEGRDAPPATTSLSGDSGKPLFRVQTGSFMASANAQALADALRRRGYKTSTRTEQDSSGKTVYKVQTGAFHSREAANKAALALQRSGYPAYVSPIGQ
jgi:hypothetical protein